MGVLFSGTNRKLCVTIYYDFETDILLLKLKEEAKCFFKQNNQSLFEINTIFWIIIINFINDNFFLICFAGQSFKS